jgi:16S rRNA pseudouridine516 synthase
MQLQQLLFSQGFGTRHECSALIAQGRVALGGDVVRDPWAEFAAAPDLRFRVDGVDWPYHETALLMLHKPAGVECSRRPRDHPGVLSLLPPPLRRRGVQPVGRLDADTTGLLLLTDGGALLHQLTHPKRRVPKVYEVTLRHPFDDRQRERLLAGVVLADDPAPVHATACDATGTHTLRLTLTGGRYHQVKRMLAAVGNRVEALHRSGFGALRLPADLLPGQWRWVEPAEVLAPAASSTIAR